MLDPVNNLCTEGFFCAEGSRFSEPAEDLVSINAGKPPRQGPCPLGHYCPKGTAYPFKCPIGTYNDKEQKTKLDDCKPCDAGYYGETMGLK